MTGPFVVVHEAGSHIEALILKGLLESEGVRARVAGEELSDEFANAARLAGGLSQVLVAPEDRKRALELLQEHEEARRTRPTGDGEDA